MKFDQASRENNLEKEDALVLLESVNVDTATNDELKSIVKHLQKQFKERYEYLVGDWRNAHRAKSTRNGQFVSAQEVIDYLNQ
ncbi:MAG: hypothetical protein KAW87_05960 [Candidatus Cloacimonetes bacterium]|nr:hypothetical protein [Candidatus Cloacimonadota bacterium]